MWNVILTLNCVLVRYGVIEDELMYGVMSTETEKQMPYDPTYPISPTMFRLPSNPYGSKTYLSSRTSDYGYSPTKYLNTEPSVYGSRDFRDSSVTAREHDAYPPRDFRDSGIATMLKNDYQRKMEGHYDYNDRMSDGSDKHHPHDKYLFPYTGWCASSTLVEPVVYHVVQNSLFCIHIKLFVYFCFLCVLFLFRCSHDAYWSCFLFICFSLAEEDHAHTPQRLNGDTGQLYKIKTEI